MSESLSGLMREYFSPHQKKRLNESLPKEVPIQAKKSTWKVTEDGSSLMREFQFEQTIKLRYFINELLALEDELDHRGQILIDDKVVKVKVRTKTLDRITEIDVEYAAQLDKIFKDIYDYADSKNT
jgi:pterin-4a-carbinolamine dehydratase